MWLHPSPTDVPWLLSSSLPFCRYCFSLRAVVADMFLPPNLLNQTTVPCLYSAWFRILKKKPSMRVSSRWSSFKLCFTCPLWFNSRVLHKFSVTVGGMVVILHGKDWSKSFIIHHPPNNWVRGSLLSSEVCVCLCLGRLLPRQPHRLSAVLLAPLFRWHHRRIGSCVLPANWRDPLWWPWILDSGKHAL